MPDKAPKSAFRNRLTSKIYMLTIFRPTFSFIFRPMFSFIFRQCNQYRNQCRNSFSQTYPLWKDSISCSSSTNVRPRSWWSGAKIISILFSKVIFVFIFYFLKVNSFRLCVCPYRDAHPFRGFALDGLCVHVICIMGVDCIMHLHYQFLADCILARKQQQDNSEGADWKILKKTAARQ